MNKLWAIAAAASLLMLAGFLGLDRIVNAAFPAPPSPAWGQGVRLLEVASGFPLSTWTAGCALLLVALVLLLARRTEAARIWLAIAAVHFAARLLGGTMKTMFPRLRPFEFTDPGASWADQWFTGAGNAFPSGHGAHFWSLVVPLAVAYPRVALCLLPIPLFVSTARIAVHDHWLSDLAGALLLTTLLTLLAHRYLSRTR